MRRYVTPADINGTGRVLQYNNGNYSGTALANSDVGADQWGRVVVLQLFPAAGPARPGNADPAGHHVPHPCTTAAIFPWTSGEAYPIHDAHERDARGLWREACLEEQQPAPRLRGAAASLT